MWKKFSQTLENVLGFAKGKNGEYTPRFLKLGVNEIVIRSVTQKDIPGLLAVERDVYFGAVPWTASAFKFELAGMAPHLYLCASTNQEVIGFIGVRIRGNDAHITNVAVRSEDRKSTRLNSSHCT
jgi:ribosomal-protein-alanine N-acetyltransferase